MKNYIYTITICPLLIIYLLLVPARTFAEAPSSPEELKNRLVKAINEQNAKQLKSLFNWDGVDDQMKQLSDRVVKSIMDGKVKNAELMPLPDDFNYEFLKNGIKYTPNIELLGIIKISYEKRGNEILGDSKIAYGIKEGKYYLPNTITEKTGYEGPPDKTINVNVIGTTAPDPVLFEGYCIYNVSGVEKKKLIKGEGNISEAFWGQDVKSCSIKRSSASGSLKLIITVGGETLFESVMKETPEISYP